MKEYLKLEQEADTTLTANLLATMSLKALERKELAVLNLVVESLASALGGRTVVTLKPDKAVVSEFNPCVKVGDIVGMHPQKAQFSSENGLEAIVTKVAAEIDIAFEHDHEIPDGRVCLVKLVNTATYNRMNWALDHLNEDAKLHRIVQGLHTPAVERLKFQPLGYLNHSQKIAVEYALGSDLAIIHGPPGTGKTFTIVEVARQLVARGQRVLICGPSNVSVDNIIERLSPHFKTHQLIRLGHPARLAEGVVKHSLDIASRTSDSGQIVAELRKEIDGTLAKLKKTKLKSQRREIYQVVRELRKDLKQREKGVVRNILLGAKIVVSTLHTSGSTFLNTVAKPLFDTVIIDEVSQSLVPQCLVPLIVDPHMTKLIIAGDNKQLPPTIVSNDPEVKRALEKTLFDTLKEYYGTKVIHLLDVQYRMPTEIMQFPSQELYEGKLKVEEPVASQKLCDLDGVTKDSCIDSVILWIDTLGQHPEQKDEDSPSYHNSGECDLVAQHVATLENAGVKARDIGIISPYSAQVSALKKIIANDQIEVATVDGFQGREKQVIIISLVRSNDSGSTGFVSDVRRINVAITRPKRHLCIVGDSECMSKSGGFLKDWVEWCTDNADIVYAD